jgi:DNA mismatch repair ATPase MutS
MFDIMRQYYEAKQQHPDALIMFRMGDFYESFGEDAATMARELDISPPEAWKRIAKRCPWQHGILCYITWCWYGP